MCRQATHFGTRSEGIQAARRLATERAIFSPTQAARVLGSRKQKDALDLETIDLIQVAFGRDSGVAKELPGARKKVSAAASNSS